ncbi:MAG: hypothetical protein RL662_1442, partial [Bacteroidota bacterium]
MKTGKRYIISFSVLAVMSFIIINSCKKKDPLPHNPYDDIVHEISTPPA